MPSLRARILDLQHRKSKIFIYRDFFQSLQVDFWAWIGKRFPSRYENYIRSKFLRESRLKGSFLASPKLWKWEFVVKEWSEGWAHHHWGNYHLGVALRQSAMARAYELCSADPTRVSPHLMSPSFVSNIGHIAFLGTFFMSQASGIVSDNPRKLVVGAVGNEELLLSLRANFQAEWSNRAGPLETLRTGLIPRVWPLVEQLEMVNARGEFIEFHAFWERVWGRSAHRVEGLEIFSLSPDYEGRAREKLASIGVDLSQPFVALHLRENPNAANDLRMVDRGTYVDALRYLRQEGYQIVRFGHKQSPFTIFPDLVDCATLAPGDTNLDAFLLKHARFLIATHGGPACAAMALGTPVLQTNVISIGRSTLTGRSLTRHIPKRIYDSSSRREFSLAEILGHSVAYVEQRYPQNCNLLNYQDNSPGEIKEAVEEMVIEDRSSSLGGEVSHNQVDEIRTSFAAVSYGMISQSFLNASPRYLD